jgi:hypothetical protein
VNEALVSDHNATDPVMQKVAIYGADFFAHFNGLIISPLSIFFFQSNIFYFLILDTPLFVSTSQYALLIVLNSLQLGKHRIRMAANSTQACILVRRENY